LLDYSAAAFNGILLARGSSPMLEEQTDQIVFADELAKVRKAKNGINISKSDTNRNLSGPSARLISIVQISVSQSFISRISADFAP
jgi:hypothetical protein